MRELLIFIIVFILFGVLSLLIVEYTSFKAFAYMIGFWTYPLITYLVGED